MLCDDSINGYFSCKHIHPWFMLIQVGSYDNLICKGVKLFLKADWAQTYLSLGLGVLRTLSLSSTSGPLSLWLYTSRLS